MSLPGCTPTGWLPVLFHEKIQQMLQTTNCVLQWAVHKLTPEWLSLWDSEIQLSHLDTFRMREVRENS